MQLITAPVPEPDLGLTEIVLGVARLTLAKRLWRAVAADGSAFGFELDRPLRHGECFWEAPGKRYVVSQQPEAVVEISLELSPSTAAGIGWAVGNLHLELCAEPTRLLAPDEPAVRQLLDRLQVPFNSTTAIFLPGRFSRGALPIHELGSSHKH